MRSAIEGYGSIPNILKLPGTFVATDEMFLQEKLDGSQFRFAVMPKREQLDADLNDTELRCWSRGGRLDLHSHDKLFGPAIETVKRLYVDDKLQPGLTYCAEALASKRHNIVDYKRPPRGGLVLFDVFDVEPGLDGAYLLPERVEEIGHDLDLEVAPYVKRIAVGETVEAAKLIEEAKQAASMLGGPVEGFVLKAASMLDKFGGLWRAKVINPSFSETKRLPKNDEGGVIAKLRGIGASVATPMRWSKVVQRLAADGVLGYSTKDIGPVIKAVVEDVEKEEVEAVKAHLYGAFRKEVLKGSTAGLADWYQGFLGQREAELAQLKSEGAATSAALEEANNA